MKAPGGRSVDEEGSNKMKIPKTIVHLAVCTLLVGGGIGIIAGLYQALRMFRVDASVDPERFLRGVYVSEAIKIVLTVALMIAAIRTLNVRFLPFMLGYVATYVVYWAALGTGYPWLDDKTAELKEQ